MQRPPDVYVTYDVPNVGCAALGIGMIIAVALAYEPLMWVDQHTFPIFGYVVYPVEWAVNKLAFPDAITPLRGNVGALLVGALLAFLAALIAGALAVVVGSFCWLGIGAATLIKWLIAATDFVRAFHNTKIKPLRNRTRR